MAGPARQRCAACGYYATIFVSKVTFIWDAAELKGAGAIRLLARKPRALR